MFSTVYWFPRKSCSVKHFIPQNVIQNKKCGTHRFPPISGSTRRCAGRIPADSQLQEVCKGFTAVVSFSTFPAVVTEEPGLQRLNSLLCFADYIINCKQKATRKAQILPLSTLKCPSSKEAPLQAHRFNSQLFSLATLCTLQRPPFILRVHTVISIYTYVCALPAAHIQAHLWGWHSAHREVGPSVSLKRNCQAVMGFGGQPRALLSPGRQASQQLQFVPRTTWPRSLTRMPKQRGFQRGKKRGELTGTPACDQDLLCGGDYCGQCCCG